MLDKVYIKDSGGYSWWYVDAAYINTIRGTSEFEDFGYSNFFDYVTAGEIWVNDTLTLTVDLEKKFVAAIKLIGLGLTYEEAMSLLEQGMSSVVYTLDAYAFMGDQVIGDYTYYGYKRVDNASWRIMRKDKKDSSAWKYASGTTGWVAAWAAPAAQSYGIP